MIPHDLSKRAPHAPLQVRLITEQAHIGIEQLVAKRQTREAAALGEAIDPRLLNDKAGDRPVRDRASVELVAALRRQRQIVPQVEPLLGCTVMPIGTVRLVLKLRKPALPITLPHHSLLR